MPNLKQLKALRKLMQEEGLFQQAKLEAAINPRVSKTLSNPELSEPERKFWLRQNLQYPKENQGSLDNIINHRGERGNEGTPYTNPRGDAYRKQDEESFWFGFPRDGSKDPLSRVNGVDEIVADKLKAVKNYPSKDLEQNETFRNLIEHYKNYPELTALEEVPDVWNKALKSKTEDKWNEIKRMIEKKRSE